MTPNLVAIAAIIGGTLFPSDSLAQSFSCSIGKKAACLDYGDKVCSTFAKCVDQKAACFDQFQCNYEGFTCKSNVTKIASKYDDLVEDYNRLVRSKKSLAEDYDELLSTSRSLLAQYEEMKSDAEAYEQCVRLANNLEEARDCQR